MRRIITMPFLIKIITRTLLLYCLIMTTGCATYALVDSSSPIIKIYDHYEVNEILSIALVEASQIKHPHSGLKKLDKYAIDNALNNIHTYMAICMSGKQKGTGAKTFTIYGLLPKKEDITSDFYHFTNISSFPGCYEYNIIDHKRTPMSVGFHPSYPYHQEQQYMDFESTLYGKKIRYIISEYTGPNYISKINYLYYPAALGAIVIDVSTAPLQAIIGGVFLLLFRDMGRNRSDPPT